MPTRAIFHYHLAVWGALFVLVTGHLGPFTPFARGAVGSGGECLKPFHCNDGDPCTLDRCPIREVEPDGRPGDFKIRYPENVIPIDLDGDGDLDVVSTSDLTFSSSYDSIIWLENDGAEEFTLRLIDTRPQGVGGISVADVDVDGDLDILTGSFGEVAWYENDGVQGFTPRTVGTDVERPGPVIATDMDGDGDVDVLVSSADSSSPYDDTKIVWYENDGAENFVSHRIATADPYVWFHSLHAFDLDQDGDVDVLSASYNTNTVEWHENDGSENFETHVITTNLVDAGPMQAVDLDGDSDVDVVACSGSGPGGKVEWYENDGAENFTPRAVDNVSGCGNLSVIDLDGDADLDFVFSWTWNFAVLWYENDGLQNFTAHTITDNTVAKLARMSLADLDEDGDIDLVSDAVRSDVLAWWENDGSENFVRRVFPIPLNLGDVRSVYAADVDGDGDLDVVSGSETTAVGVIETVAWYENDGAEKFEKHVILVAPAYSVAALDLDGDGDVDVAFAGRDVAWLENDGSESFTLHTLTGGQATYRSLFAVDLDADGDTDLLSASRNSPPEVGDAVEWWQNDGGGNFTGHVVAGGEFGWYESVYAADVDGDGDVDVVSGSGGSRIAWHENDGSESFSSHVVTTSVASLNAVSAADVDGDGDTDLLSASRDRNDIKPEWDDDKIAWYENDGSEKFKQHVIASDIDSRTQKGLGVTPADVDGDGDVDVVPASAGGLEWYENDGTGKFTTRVIGHGFGESVFVADLDGDMHLDFIYGANSGERITWYRNVPVAATVATFRTCSHSTIEGCECGNGVVEGDELCDDGNQVGGDGCSAECGGDGPMLGDNQQCVIGLNKAATKVARAQSNQNAKCVFGAVRDRLATPTAKQCLTSRGRERVSKALAKVTSTEARKCADPEDDPPGFGFAGSVAAGYSSWVHALALAADAFGDDLDAAMIDRGLDRDGASCQQTVAKWSSKILTERLNAFLRCKSDGLQSSAVRSGSDLRDDCLPAMLDDEKVTRAVAIMAAQVGKKCEGVFLDAAFPGACAGAPGFVSCIDERIVCRACLMLGRADAFAVDCDAFDDGLANGSCSSN